MGWLANNLDTLIGELSPIRARNRALARAQLETLRNYRPATDAGLRTRVRDKGAGNVVMGRDGVTMRNWARHLDKNNPVIRAMIRYLAQHAMGCTIAPMASRHDGKPAEDYNAALAELWELHQDEIDYSRNATWPELCELIGVSWVRDGEVFPHLLIGDAAGNADLPIAINALESDFLPYSMSDRTDLIHGVELDSAGRVLRYHFYRQHPGDALRQRFALETVAIPAAEVLALKHTIRLGQLRGVTMLDSSIETAADLDEYLVAERVAAKFAACVGVQIVRSSDAQAPDTNADGDRTIDFEPGMTLTDLLPGEKAEMMSMSRPTQQFPSYLKALGRHMAAGPGANYSASTNDYDGTYSSQRQMLVTGRMHELSLHGRARARMYRPLWAGFVRALQLAGKLPSTRGVDLRTLTRADFIPVPVPWIDPQKEAAADRMQIEDGIESRHGVIRRRGGDPRRVDREREYDKANDSQRADPASETGRPANAGRQ